MRKQLGYPPFRHLAVIGFKSKDLRLVGDWARMYAASLQKVDGLEVSEALPSVIEKADGEYRWQVVVLAQSAARIVQSWRWLTAARPLPKEIRAGLDVDAYDLI